MTDATPALQAVPDEVEMDPAAKEQLELEVQLAQAQEQEAMNATVNKHLNTRVVELRLQVNRLTKENEALRAELPPPPKQPEDHKPKKTKAKKSTTTPRKKADS